MSLVAPRLQFLSMLLMLMFTCCMLDVLLCTIYSLDELSYLLYRYLMTMITYQINERILTTSTLQNETEFQRCLITEFARFPIHSRV